MFDATTVARRIETDVPARLDRLTWSRFHTLVVVALGITWVLDGVEVTSAGSIAGALEKSPVLHFTAGDVGLASSCYLVGAVAGALYFGWLTDRLGRKKLFFITLAVYLTATAATAFSWNVWSFCFFRLLTGAGIGGEYSAINSTIQELIPARYRGHTDLAINGSFWIGAAIGALASVVLLDPAYFSIDVGWYILPFAVGNVLGPLILGRFFDTIGRKVMISFTYILSGVLLAATGWMFDAGLLSANAQTICWSVIFFFASAAAGAAYLTVSETFPIEIRALAIAFFYAIGTGVGGVAGPILFGYLIESGSRGSVFLGYLLGAVLMVIAGIVEAIWGVAAERKSLETIATPLSMVTT